MRNGCDCLFCSHSSKCGVFRSFLHDIRAIDRTDLQVAVELINVVVQLDLELLES